ncbi:unnamed protein product [Callosobruchus maculatus]|uniref:Histone deacetylase 8 n=1 Tax=Callosobruchus maculatus TaxID=64391 RepID=A0A653C1S2_CALMS|nr:unnamed protein product [Callosobruchus maculatus]
MNINRIIYIYKKSLVQECNRLPGMPKRASMVQDLINSYNLLLDDRFLVVQSADATDNELKSFHSTAYIEYLKNVGKTDSGATEDPEYFGLTDECPVLPNNDVLVKIIAGGSISAAKLLVAKKCNIAINWFGGWHHAQRDSAEGFCYVNDVVLAIQILRKSFERILYVDLDIHHGNGVQNAFEYSNKILTLSFHQKTAGFYPGTGGLEDIGCGEGKYYSVNVPFLEGIGHENYTKVFKEVFKCVLASFPAKAIVVQCGADGLNGDPIGRCNLTLETYGDCVKEILKCDLPTLFLGGGGYNFANASRLWTYLTAVIANIHLDNDIPDESEYFPEYGPSYELEIPQGLQKDMNSKAYIEDILNAIKSHCTYLK